MCIIIAKNKDNRIPTLEELKESFTYNNDGAGFMYVKNGKVVIDKGYMSLDRFLERYKELCKEFNYFKGKSLVVHCRIGTSSGNTAKNTHPYPITYKEGELHKTSIECDLGMAHNGIIHDYTPTWANPTTNDTQEFILKYVYPIYEKWNDFYKNRYILESLEKITNSKLAFLDSDDNLYLVGDFITDDNLKFSNGSYRTYTTYNYGYSSYGTNNVKSLKSGWDLDDDDSDYVGLETSSYINDIDKRVKEYSYDYFYDIYGNGYDYTKIWLKKGYHLYYRDNWVEVDEDDLYIWDYNTGNIYILDEFDRLMILEENVEVFDEDNEILI